MNNFPQMSIGTVRGIDSEYVVHWIEPDLAQLTIDGELHTAFCSVRSGGFLDTDDVIDQAENVVAEYDAEWLDGDDLW